MQDESQIEKSTSPELSPTEILSQMSRRADEIITDSETVTTPLKYLGVKRSVSESGIETVSLSSRSGAGLNRTSDPETGATMYELSVLFHGTGDRGTRVYSWSSLEPTLDVTVNSEVNGRTDPITVTESEEIKSTQQVIERYFPEQQSKPDTTRQSFARKILARLRK